VSLLDLDLLLIADNVFLVPIFLALYVLLRRDSQSLMAVATVLGFLGIVFFIASNPAFEMLSLSQRYAAAATEAGRSTFLAAGEAVLATWEGTAFQIYYLLGSIAGIVIGAVMLRSAVFSNLAGWPSWGTPSAWACTSPLSGCTSRCSRSCSWRSGTC
jgi:Domain of unknown function (DUF4386)